MTKQNTVEVSMAWIRSHAEDIGVNDSALIAAARLSLKSCRVTEWARENEGAVLAPEFWDHFEVVTGLGVPEGERGRIFP